MRKEFDEAVTAILNRYARYGVDRKTVEELLKSGMDKNGFSLRASYNGIRMCLAGMYNEHENFTVEDIMDITGESREEVVCRIEEMLENVKQMGGNPDDYAKRIKAPSKSVFYFNNGLKM